MCDCQKREPLKFSSISSVKVLGPKVGKGKPGKSPKMRDADSDGKCQEENGKWIPCPPGTPTGSVINAAGNAIGTISGNIGDITKRPTESSEPDSPVKLSPDEPVPYDRMGAVQTLFARENSGPREFDDWAQLVNFDDRPRRVDPNSDLPYEDRREAYRALRAQQYEDYVDEYWRRNSKDPEKMRAAKLADEARFREAELIEGAFNNDGSINEEGLNKYIQGKRDVANAKAQKIAEQNVNTGPSKTQLDAAKAANLDELYTTVDWGGFDMDEWNRENPKPTADMFDLQDEYEEALYDWAYAKEHARDDKEDIKQNFREQMKTMFTNDEIIGANGKKYKTVVYGTDADLENEQVEVRGYIVDDAGNQIGIFHRSFHYDHDAGKWYVEHDHLMVNESEQKANLGSIFNARNEELYRTMGIDKIKVGAYSSTGNYKGVTHWAKQGYDWMNEDEREKFLEVIQEVLQDTNDDEIDDVFGSVEQRKILEELVNSATDEEFSDHNIMAGDLIRWPGAEKAFKDKVITIYYNKDI